MIYLIAGASHTGKTALAQKLLERRHVPYLSLDHLKMGLIRSGNTALTPMSADKDLTAYLWPIVREMVKTAIENEQNLIVEGVYIPPSWRIRQAPPPARRAFSARIFLLQDHQQPVDEPIHHAGADAVDDDGAGDGEHFCTHAEDKALCSILYCGRYHRICKTGYGN